MLSQPLRLFVLVTVLVCAGCVTKPQFRGWSSYVDQLETGSLIEPSRKFFTDSGDVEVVMTKASDPDADEQNPSYPYVGLQLRFPGRQPADLSDAENLVLTYKLSGPMSLLLAQENIAPGNEFRLELPPASEYSEIHLNWSDFSQPDWVSPRSTLDRTRLTAVKFQITTPEDNTAQLGVRRLEFPGHSF